MSTEIERKFLLNTLDLSFLKGRRSVPVLQGYLHETGMTSRVRVMGRRAFLTLKGKAKGCSRPEYEYPIPLADAKEMLSRHATSELVSKVRHYVTCAGMTWEVDVFKGKHEGLVIAEIELQFEDQVFEKPTWVGDGVTHIKSLSNKSLAYGKNFAEVRQFFIMVASTSNSSRPVSRTASR
jgi:adenylate cyclase